MRKFLSQGHAEDIILRHRYLYYVENQPTISDQDYDALEREVKAQFSIGVTSHTVGSSNPLDYPSYIREGVRPDKVERELRDQGIADRWLKLL